MNEAEAAAALAAAARADAGLPPEGGSAPVAPEQAPPAPETSAEGDVGTTPAPAEDSFTNIDPATLPPELQAQYRNMQGHFTQAMQKLAPLRDVVGEADPAEIAEAYQFAKNLQSDPNYAVQVYQDLGQALQAAGLTPEEAHEVAASAVEQAQDQDFDFDDEPVGVPPSVLEKLNELEAWKTQVESERAEQEIAAQLQRQEMAIREAHPEYGEADVDDIYNLAFATGGDLSKAADLFEAQRQRVISSYIEKKTSVPAGVNPPATTGAAQQPIDFRLESGEPDLEAYHKAATERLQQVLNAEE